MTRLAIVSPCYNEEAVLDSSARRLDALFDRMTSDGLIAPDSFVLFVNDGSRDSTWEIISRLHKANPHRFKGLDLARNVGHQNAIMAGMMTARDMADAVITIDADLQDDLDAIPRMVEAFAEGYDVVYGVKVERTADPVLKRLSAQAFYRLQEKMGVKAIYNHADFRLLSRRVLDELSRYREKNLYLRGIIPQIGFPSTTVEDAVAGTRRNHILLGQAALRHSIYRPDFHSHQPRHRGVCHLLALRPHRRPRLGVADAVCVARGGIHTDFTRRRRAVRRQNIPGGERPSAIPHRPVSRLNLNRHAPPKCY